VHPTFMPVLIREEAPGDAAAVWRVNELAFGQSNEAEIVQALRAAGAVRLSLVAEEADELVGRTHLVLAGDDRRRRNGAGPFAHGGDPTEAARGSGIGAALARLADAGHGAVVVVGHATYHPRFGFVPASRFGLRWEHGHDDAFMAIELRPVALDGHGGVVRYRPEMA
jgi:putative acetyltransferase